MSPTHRRSLKSSSVSVKAGMHSVHSGTCTARCRMHHTCAWVLLATVMLTSGCSHPKHRAPALRPAIQLDVPKGFEELSAGVGEDVSTDERYQRTMLRRLDAIGPRVRLEKDRWQPWASITVNELISKRGLSLARWADILRSGAPTSGGSTKVEGWPPVRFSPLKQARIAGLRALRWSANGEYRKGIATEVAGVLFTKGDRTFFVTMSFFPGHGPTGPTTDTAARSLARDGFEHVLKTLRVSE